MSGRIDPDRATDTRGRGTQGHLSPDPVLDLGQMRWRETLHQPPDGRRRRRGHRVQRLLGRIGAAPVHPDRKVPRSTARATSTPTNNPSAQVHIGFDGGDLRVHLELADAPPVRSVRPSSVITMSKVGHPPVHRQMTGAEPMRGRSPAVSCAIAGQIAACRLP